MQIIRYLNAIVLPEWVAIFLVGFLLVVFSRLLFWSLNLKKDSRYEKIISIIFVFTILILIFSVPVIYRTVFIEFDNQLIPMFLHF